MVNLAIGACNIACTRHIGPTCRNRYGSPAPYNVFRAGNTIIRLRNLLIHGPHGDGASLLERSNNCHVARPPARGDWIVVLTPAASSNTPTWKCLAVLTFSVEAGVGRSAETNVPVHRPPPASCPPSRAGPGTRMVRRECIEKPHGGPCT
jgi:hypothetical protein